MSKAHEPKEAGLGTDGSDPIAGGPGKNFVFGSGDGDRLETGIARDRIAGDAGSDRLVGGNGSDLLLGLDGDLLVGGADAILGDQGKDVLAGGTGRDTLTGGEGKDSFLFDAEPFSEGAPAPVGTTGISGLNRPDVITDFEIGRDDLALDSDVFAIDELRFASGVTAELAGDANLIVQLDPFANAAAAAAAIAANDAITADAGFFVYFNTTLGIHRLVHSEDLSDGGDFSVLANLANQTDAATLAAHSAGDFLLV